MRNSDLEDGTSEHFISSKPRDFTELLAEMSLLPKEWLSSCEQTVLGLDEETFHGMLSDISFQYPNLVQELSQLLNNLRFDIILDLVQKAINQSSNE